MYFPALDGTVDCIFFTCAFSNFNGNRKSFISVGGVVRGEAEPPALFL